MLNFIAHTPLLGLILGPLVTYAGDYVHSLWSWLDNQKPIVKQSFALVLSVVFVGLTQLIPGVVPQECTNVAAQGLSSACESALASGPFLQSVISTLVAIAIKHGQQSTKTA